MLSEAIRILQKYYGYASFREGQGKIIESLLSGRDTLGIMPTGGGKSICYQVPALLFSGVTIVISPLISLMKDQVDGLSNLGIPATFINSSLEGREVTERIYKAFQGHYKLIYIAPERLESPAFRQTLHNLPLSIVAVDEAHCVSQWGHDFRPSYFSIAQFVAELPKRPLVAAFTATATQEVVQDMVVCLNLKNQQVFITGFDRANLSFSVVQGEKKQDFLLKHISNNGDSSGIIYAATRKEVDKLYAILGQKGLSVGRYHAGLSDEERSQAQEAFLYDDIQIMVATNAFGMGIDKSNVRYVIHNNMPKNMEAYYQEAGRAGRDGAPGQCILLFSPQDIHIQRFLIELGQMTPERKSLEYQRLQAMIDYCHTPQCLRQYILQYFGEKQSPAQCSNCGNCNSDVELTDITLEAQKILSCIRRMREQYGMTMVADVLKGSKNQKIQQFSFDKLSTYGLMKEQSQKSITDLIQGLVAQGYIEVTQGQYPVLKLNQKAAPVLKGEERVLHRVRVVRAQEKSLDKLDWALFERLRQLRKELAQRELVPPYVVFADTALREMSQRLPRDKKAFLKVPGVGEKKLERYGEAFLAVIKQYCQEKGIPEPSSANKAHPNKLEEVKEDSIQNKGTHNGEILSHQVTLQMVLQGLSLDEIAETRKMTVRTVENHLVRCGQEGLEVNWSQFIPWEHESLILETIRTMGSEKLGPIKEALPEEISYFMISAVMGKYSLLR